MKFRLFTTSRFYDEREKGKLEKLGFKFKERRERSLLILDDQLTIELNTLEELINLSNEYGELLFNTLGELSIEIYDGYRE